MLDTVTQFCMTYKVPRPTVLPWINVYQQNQQNSPDHIEFIADELSISAIQAFVATRLHCNDPHSIASIEEFGHFINQQIEATEKRLKFDRQHILA